MADDMRIDPWGSSQSTDYSRIIDHFGLQSLDGIDLPNPSHLHRRGIVFAHRDLDLVIDSNRKGDPFGVLTGLMPSGRMHLGHSMVIEQANWFQKLGGDVTIAVADLESNATRGISLSEGRRVAKEEYVANYAALGLNPENTNVYFQSERSIVQRLGFQLGKRTNMSEFESIYGFDGATNLAHIQAPLVQAGDILHPQLEDYGGLRPIVVPVGVDQDPHLRLTRGLASKTNWFNVNEAKMGLQVGISLQEENSEIMGVMPNGRINKEKQKAIFDGVVNSIKNLGFSDIMSNPKHGTVNVPSATRSDKASIRLALLSLERSLGGMGLLAPSSTYHRFAIGMTGDKMSSSKPKTTLFLTDDKETTEKKIKKSFSGGQATVEEHRRLGGNPDVDVAYQYMMYFFEKDDVFLEEINQGYRSGKILAGEMKQMCIDRATEWLSNLKEKRDETEHLVELFFE
ncbi:MAG: tryptophan--tRNA ligase [Candidatus Poseidoniaceae archaeon]|jgi:tryptophanyl-tRNA synthetase|nr:tryptophan--tRNA ligase [Candidatus Poseidoniaceae archaeon]